MDLCLNVAGFPERIIREGNRATNKERFKDFYFVKAKTLSALYRDIQHPDLGEARIDKPDPNHLLHALYFLKIDDKI